MNYYRAGLLLLLMSCCATSTAHEIRPAIVSIDFDATRYDVVMVVNAEALLAGIGPQHRDTDDAPSAATYNELRAAPPDAIRERFRGFTDTFLAGLDLRFDGRPVTPRLVKIEVPAVGDLARSRRTRVSLAGDVPAGARQFVWTFSEGFGSSVLKLRNAGDDQYLSKWLKPGTRSAPFTLGIATAAPDRLAVAWQYLALGFTHIVPKGLDHILFVLGLFLLSTQWRPLLWQVTAFTVAHSITLGLSIYGWISLSPQIVEPLIALSIVYVAVENVFAPTLKPWRVAIVFAFGLLHGMGFAGVLQELGLPRSEFLTALVTFNLGVEFGQLVVIASAFAAVGLWRADTNRYRRTIVVPGSLAIALVGTYWTIERTWQAWLA